MWNELKPWIKDGIIGFAVGLVLFLLRSQGIMLPFLSDWVATNMSLAVVGATMIVAYTIAGIFIGELITEVIGIERK